MPADIGDRYSERLGFGSREGFSVKVLVGVGVLVGGRLVDGERCWWELKGC